KTKQLRLGVGDAEAIHEYFDRMQNRNSNFYYIMKKIPKKLRGYSMYERIRIALDNVVYDCFTNEEFEENLAKFIVQFNLENNAWLRDLYEERH
ncbi:hypothetical protein CFOL_v3_07097, partial [Cephalotus follicularis]